MTIAIPKPTPIIAGSATRISVHELRRLRAAAKHATRVYPGALGELVSRELNASADLERTIGVGSLIARVASEVLATPVDGHHVEAEPSRPESWYDGLIGKNRHR
jgi:hypothetical protein